MKPRESNFQLRGGIGTLSLPPYKLSLAREGFIYRGAYLFNSLDEHIRNEENTSRFKIKAKEWVKKNISVKPKSNFPSLYGNKLRLSKDSPLTTGPAMQDEPQRSQDEPNKITKYFKPLLRQ